MGDLPNVCVTANTDPLHADSQLSDVRTHTSIRFENVLDKNVYHVAKTTGAAC